MLGYWSQGLLVAAPIIMLWCDNGLVVSPLWASAAHLQNGASDTGAGCEGIFVHSVAWIISLLFRLQIGI